MCHCGTSIHSSYVFRFTARSLLLHYLRRLIEDRVFIALIAIGTIIVSLIPTIHEMMIISSGYSAIPSIVSKLANYGMYVDYIVIGYVLHETTPLAKPWAYVVAFCLIVFGLIWSFTIYYGRFIANNLSSSVGYCYTGTVLATTAFISLLTSLELSGHSMNIPKWVPYLAINAYGIYVTHHPILILLPTPSIPYGLSVILLFVVDLLASWLLVWLLGRNQTIRVWALQQHR